MIKKQNELFNLLKHVITLDGLLFDCKENVCDVAC